MEEEQEQEQEQEEEQEQEQDDDDDDEDNEQEQPPARAWEGVRRGAPIPTTRRGGIGTNRHYRYPGPKGHSKSKLKISN